MPNKNPSVLHNSAYMTACLLEQSNPEGECQEMPRLARPLGVHKAYYSPLISEGLDWMTETIVLYNYDIESDELSTEHLLMIEEFALILVDNPEIQLDFIIGRASQTGPEISVPDGYGGNIPLSQQRAQQVGYALEQRLKDFLGDEAAVYDRIGDIDPKTLDYGSSDPIKNRPGYEEAINRSVTIEYSYPLNLPTPVKTEHNTSCTQPSTLWVLDFDQEVTVDLRKIYKYVKKIQKATVVSVDGGGNLGVLKDLVNKRAYEVYLLFFGLGVSKEIPLAEGAKVFFEALSGNTGKQILAIIKELLVPLYQKTGKFWNALFEQPSGFTLTDEDINYKFQTLPVCPEAFHYLPVIRLDGGMTATFASAGLNAIIPLPTPWHDSLYKDSQDLEIDFTSIKNQGFPLPFAVSHGFDFGFSGEPGIEASATFGILFLGAEIKFVAEG